MSLRPLRPALLLLAACNLPTYDSSTGASTATTSTTSGTTETSATPTTSSTNTEPGNTSCNILDCAPDPPPPECDIWNDDCPEGQKCTPYGSDGNTWDSLKCVPIGPDPHQPGEPCTVQGSATSGLDSCERHAFCWNVDDIDLTGECVPFCLGPPEEPSCADPLDGCTARDDTVLPLCLPQCDPIAQDCDHDESCIPAPLNRDTFLCILALAAYGEPFQPCDTSYHCNPGLACLQSSAAVECDPMASGCCLPFCDLDEPNTCPGQGQQCVPWYADPNDAAPFNTDVGACALPTP